MNQTITITIPTATGGRGVKGSQNSKRDATIVGLIANGETIRSVGSQYGVSGERIRQIYKKYTGRPAKERHFRKIALIEHKKKQHKFTCLTCGRDVKFGESPSRRTFCRRCVPTRYNTDGSRITFKIKCSGCGKLFHPKMTQFQNGLRNKRYRGNMYHDRDCFYKHGFSKK